MKYTKNKKQIKNKSKKGGFLRTLSNMSRKAEEYGDTDFMSFVGAALSRMAYESDFSKTQTPEIKTKNFLNLFSCTMGGIIEDELLSGIGNADVSDLFNDSKIFADYKVEKHEAQGQEKSSEKKTGEFIDFKPMAEMFNILTGEELTSPTAKKLLNNGTMEAVYTVGESIKFASLTCLKKLTIRQNYELLRQLVCSLLFVSTASCQLTAFFSIK
jgi:hypothetical protein